MGKAERRKHVRYNTDAEIYFHVTYDVHTKVDFQIVDNKSSDTISTRKHHAISRNVSADAICFTAPIRIEKGALLYLEVFIPRLKSPIRMEGQVVWSEKVLFREEDRNKFDTGVSVITVDGKVVSESVHYDATNQVTWSIILESIFGKFRTMAQES